MAITFNSRRHDVTPIERFDNQWRRLFIPDVPQRQRHMINWRSSMYEQTVAKHATNDFRFVEVMEAAIFKRLLARRRFSLFYDTEQR